MHPNPAFRDTETAHNIRFARERGFGILAAARDGPPPMSHVPFLLSEDGSTADLHLVRSNPILRLLKDPIAVRIAVSGPDGYVSPDWYEIPDRVPTWNYVAVHLNGTLETRPQSELRALLDRQSTFYEARLLPKPPWTAEKMSDDALARMMRMMRMMRMIVPCRMRVQAIDRTWKLKQNKPDEVRLRASDRIGSDGFGVDTQALSALMRDALE
ncbi:FMN-binding negative transcriptional regulator [Ruegeria sp. 2205SS24-7]|uniref:FMN-binding negative transcriptional regulator n=1 Tax=Ruegeria discodermiae TaxID=3064389 RepID=UPI002740B6F2|nr:FMN-binding negative transcriptional regulator [Ruegeria sp. 2205SS24-7]MDP5219696.1 FMN-binding negative transcriptional regulator [Ruegeria sp. 2205SS24-7]